MPSKMRMAVNAASAVVRVAGAVMRGDDVLASPELAEKRLAVCGRCSQFTPVKSKFNGKIYHRCIECGCWLDGVSYAKARLATESCPLEKWEGMTC